MAKKTEKPQEDPQEHEEARDPQQIAADQQMEEFLGEPVKDGKVVNAPEETKTQEETPPQEPEKPQDVTPPPPPPDKPTDATELTDQIAERLAAKLKPEEQADERPPWEKEGRNPTWTEALNYVSEKNQREWEAKQESLRQQEEQQRKSQEEQQQAQINSYNAYWDEQLTDLRQAHKLARVEKADDPNDPGRREQAALFQKMYDVNQERLNAGKTPIHSLKEIYYEHYQSPAQQPPGADAPVSLGRKGVTPENPNQWKYEDLQKPWEDMLPPK